jgi:hypothetical protein
MRRSEVVISKPIKLSFARLENQFVIENQTDGVHIRAARDNLSPREKLFFMRYLAAEGYIPERYLWFADTNAEWYSGLRWTVDADNHGRQGQSLRQLLRVLACATLVWVALMGLAFLSARSFRSADNERGHKLTFETGPYSPGH